MFRLVVTAKHGTHTTRTQASAATHPSEPESPVQQDHALTVNSDSAEAGVDLSPEYDRNEDSEIAGIVEDIPEIASEMLEAFSSAHGKLTTCRI